jgi:hypothetical protein
MALEETSVTKTPTEWTFDNGAHGFVHPWRHMDKGSISVKDGYLLWTTTAAQQDEDELVVGFNHPTPGPKGVRISLSSFINDAYLSVTFSDTTNQLFEHTAPILLERSTEDRTIDIPFATLKGAKSGLPPDPKQIDRLTIQNQSGRNAISGLNEIHIAHFSVY